MSTHYTVIGTFMSNIIGVHNLLKHTISKLFQVYWIGPILGGVVGALLYQVAFQAKLFKED
jgi:glycerol uptake facilitator-like aquaporin